MIARVAKGRSVSGFRKGMVVRIRVENVGQKSSDQGKPGLTGT